MELFAAIDVGSNSVRLQIAAFISGFQHQVVREDRAVTRLGEAVFQTGRLSEQAMRETLGVLKHFRRKAQESGVVALRAVGTSALREANNARRFVKMVRQECGIDLEIISTREEGRLIHLGVISRLSNPGEPLLLLDVGGGSAEFTLSRERRIISSASGPLGAVRLTEIFLESDPPAPAEIERLEGYIRQRLQRIRKTLGLAPVAAGGVEGSGASGPAGAPVPAPATPGAWNRVIGTSGSMAAVTGAVNRVDAPRSELEGQRFTATEVETLYRRLRSLDSKQRRDIPGINSKRAEIIVAGAALLWLAMRELGIAEIIYSDAGLRDGVLVDLAARQKGDVAGIQYLRAARLESVRALGERYGFAQSHSAHVAKLALELFQKLQPLHQLPDPYGELLEAAALLHDVGHYVSSVKHHKHSYYLIANSELPGYSNRERMLVASIARYHRGSWPDRDHEGYRGLTSKEQKAVEQLAALLRVADSCDNGRRGVVRSVLATTKSDRVELALLASGLAELESWAAQKSSSFFRQAFERKLEVTVEVMKPAPGKIEDRGSP